MYIVAINRTKRLALTSDDRVVPLIRMRDVDDDLTEDIEEAITAVARVTDGIWLVIRLADYPESDGRAN